MKPKPWKGYCPKVAWPTLLMGLIIPLLFAATCMLAHTNRLGLGWTFAINSLLCYLAFVPMHEAAHGNILAGNSRANHLLGWFAGICLWAPYALFRSLHLRHHSFTNDPQKDPDFFVATRSPWILPFKLLWTIPHYYHWLLVQKHRDRKARRHTILAFLLYLTVFFGVTSSSQILPLLVAWPLSAIAASVVLAFGFDWLPHHPHRETARMHNARIIDRPFLSWLLMGNGYHLIHHLYPRIPFYNYHDYYKTHMRSDSPAGKKVSKYKG